MRDFLILIGIGLMALPMAWCTVEQYKNQSGHTMSKAEFCRDQGGLYDFNWGSCNYAEPPK